MKYKNYFWNDHNIIGFKKSILADKEGLFRIYNFKSKLLQRTKIKDVKK